MELNLWKLTGSHDTLPREAKWKNVSLVIMIYRNNVAQKKTISFGLKKSRRARYTLYMLLFFHLFFFFWCFFSLHFLQCVGGIQSLPKSHGRFPKQWPVNPAQSVTGSLVLTWQNGHFSLADKGSVSNNVLWLTTTDHTSRVCNHRLFP